MKIIILEDEIPAYEKLLKLIRAHIPNVQLVGWGRSITEGKLLIEKEVDLIFSDIELLDGLSFNIFEHGHLSCPIVFCTAFDNFLFKAFKTNGIAYLLKPYTEEHFTEALEKYHSLFGKDHALDKNLLSELRSIVEGEQKKYKSRFSIKKKTGIKILQTEHITSFEANGDFCLAYDDMGDKHIVNFSISKIEQSLDPQKFFRINRSEIVNIDYILKIETHFKNRMSISITKRKDNIYTSTAKTPSFRKWLDE